MAEAASDGYDQCMGERFWDEQIAPMHRASSIPDEGIAFLRHRFLDAVNDNSNARAELVVWADTGYDPQKAPR